MHVRISAWIDKGDESRRRGAPYKVHHSVKSSGGPEGIVLGFGAILIDCDEADNEGRFQVFVDADEAPRFQAFPVRLHLFFIPVDAKSKNVACKSKAMGGDFQ
jgi:hypothetical protein